MEVLITIDGVDYNDADRAAAGIEINQLALALEGYDELAWSTAGVAPLPLWDNGMTVVLRLDDTVRFSGKIVQIAHPSQTTYGWTIGYSAQGLRFVVDQVPFTAPDGTGEYTFNRTPLDAYYVPSETGMTIGAIIEAILTIDDNAANLSAAGLNYDSLTPPTLPASTLADLALMLIVPPRPVHVSGANLMNWLNQFIQRWMPTWNADLRPDGTLRFRDTHDLTHFGPVTIALPSIGQIGDPVSWPNITRTSGQCYTRLVLRGGPDVRTAVLSEREGTLVGDWTGTAEDDWTLLDFTAPRGATDVGAVSAVTSTSVTFDSDSATSNFPANYWPPIGGRIWLINPLAAGITTTEERPITSNTAMVAGGTCTITWDASQPIFLSPYSRAFIRGGPIGKNQVGRRYLPREPSSGLTGLNTYIGSRLVVKSPKPVKWANNTQARELFFTTGEVWNSATGPSIPWTVSAIPTEGAFLFSQPTVMAFGAKTTLEAGYPTTTANGLPWDVIVFCLYSAGPLQVVVPPDVAGAPQYEGTAYTQDGMTLTKYEDMPDWIDGQSTASMQLLAQQFLDSQSDAVVEGSFDWFDFGGTLPEWDWLTFTNSVNFSIAGGVSPWTAINAPIKAIRVTWGQDPVGWRFRLSFQFSTRRRAFSGTDLYTHPAFQMGGVIGSIKGPEVNTFLQLAMLGVFPPRLSTESVQQKGSKMIDVGATAASFGRLGHIGQPVSGENISKFMGALGTGADLYDRMHKTGMDVGGMAGRALAQTDMGGPMGATGMGGAIGATGQNQYLASQGFSGPGGTYQGPGIGTDARFAIGMAGGRQGQTKGFEEQAEGAVHGTRGSDYDFQRQMDIKNEKRQETEAIERDRAENMRRGAGRRDLKSARALRDVTDPSGHDVPVWPPPKPPPAPFQHVVSTDEV